jgi:hypothetical protein
MSDKEGIASEPLVTVQWRGKVPQSVYDSVVAPLKSSKQFFSVMKAVLLLSAYSEEYREFLLRESEHVQECDESLRDVVKSLAVLKSLPLPILDGEYNADLVSEVEEDNTSEFSDSSQSEGSVDVLSFTSELSEVRSLCEQILSQVSRSADFQHKVPSSTEQVSPSEQRLNRPAPVSAVRKAASSPSSVEFEEDFELEELPELEDISEDSTSADSGAQQESSSVGGLLDLAVRV